MADNLTRLKGESYSIQELAVMASEGQLRVPEFQRSFRWDGSDVLALFDSILRGYPVGSVLLWRKAAPASRVTLGALTLDAQAENSALWVVDGQQRITSLVNAVSPQAFASDDRFKIYYSLKSEKLRRPSDVRGELAVPLPDLFDVSRLLAWLQDNPEAQPFASALQDVTARLRDFKLPASVVNQADEDVLRDIFDRMNTAGKRLRSAEIFDAIHREAGEKSRDDLSIGAIADRISAGTAFGRLEDAAIYQAILVRRHPDITRDPHGEFEGERLQNSDFPKENRESGYREAERAIERSVRFLTETAGVPHVTFLPYRFLLLVLVRFFSLYPDPSVRELELLSRWFWMAGTRAPQLNLIGSTANVRSLANLVSSDDLKGSLERLHAAVAVSGESPIIDVKQFRTNTAASKVILCALWALGPLSIASQRPLDGADLADALEGRDSPSDVAPEIIRRARLPRSRRLSSANRAIALPEIDSVMRALVDLDEKAEVTLLRTHLLDARMLHQLREGDYEGFLDAREELIGAQLQKFVRLKTGDGLELTPPLSEFDFDDLDDDEESERERSLKVTEL